MAKQSAGIIAYRLTKKTFEILLVHPGGPFFAKKDLGAWSIPKGEYENGEEPLHVAQREFNEETGNSIKVTNAKQLQPVKIKSGKVITAWAVEADFEKSFISSNLFEMEWPPKSGKQQQFYETDKAEWFIIDEAKQKINAGQLPLIEQFENLLLK